MGSTSSSTIERRNENILEILKNIPNDQYACIECNIIPEIKEIDHDKGIIQFICLNHGHKTVALKEYFTKEINHIYIIILNVEIIIKK